MAKDDDDDIEARVDTGVTVVKIEDDKKPEDAAKSKPERDDTRTAADDADDDHGEDDDADGEEGGDQVAGADGKDDPDEARREARRAERKNRRRAQREGARRNREELAELREVMGAMVEEVRYLRGMASNTQVSQIDSRLSTAEQQLVDAEAAHALAIKKGDGDSAVEAMRLARQAERAVLALKAAKAQIEGGRQRREQGDGREERGDPRRRERDVPQISERTFNLAQGWMASVPWYKPQGKDEDSELVREIDSEVMADGFNPETPAYYAELTSRVQKELPHRYTGQRNGNKREARPAPRRSGPPIGGSDRRAIGANEIALDENRRFALEQANIDPQSEKGKRILRRWKEDENQKTATR